MEGSASAGEDIVKAGSQAEVDIVKADSQAEDIVQAGILLVGISLGAVDIAIEEGNGLEQGNQEEDISLEGISLKEVIVQAGSQPEDIDQAGSQPEDIVQAGSLRQEGSLTYYLN